jgi:hypothetical protein
MIDSMRDCKIELEAAVGSSISASMNSAVRFFVGALLASAVVQSAQASEVSILSRKIGHSRKGNTSWAISVTNSTGKNARVHYEVRNARSSTPAQARLASGDLVLKPWATGVVSAVYTKRGARPEVFWQMTDQKKQASPVGLLERLARPGSPARTVPGKVLEKPKIVRLSGFDGVWEGTLSSVLNGRSQTTRIRVEITGDKVNVTNLGLGGSVRQTVVTRSENSLILRRTERGAEKTTRMALSVDRRRLFVNYWSASSPGQARGVLTRG